MIPLSVLDLAPVPAGGGPADAVRNTLDLARHAERAGYRRYWIAEHHLAPGLAAAAPPVLIAAVAAATSRIRVGSGALQTRHRTALSIVEQFGTLDALYPGRIDLGLGRSDRDRDRERATVRAAGGRRRPPRRAVEFVDGLLIPVASDPPGLARSAALKLQETLLVQLGAMPAEFADVVAAVLALLDGSYVQDGQRVRANPGEGADLEPWILGDDHRTARIAGRHGLPFAANYHSSPATVLQAVDAYRAAFRPSAVLDAPYVIVSADVVTAPTDDEAEVLASPYPLWVHRIRTGLGAVPFPTADDAAAHQWKPDELDLVADRVETQFFGSPRTVAAGLDVLQRVTGADELLITTVTHGHADRVRSYELLAAEWREAAAASEARLRRRTA
ncbi:LLM class flavin-dependent oxidoreductase [Actinomadura decatromicini]|uniref:LLM class flavin-dependent oxidoreductase n=1 Tax=Actinomadura decatromicini TaxID=2604572 RepID=A0A5D3FTD4_9ACTN|nr:LLM class flavin-dependent oxidoreductase [Actinomadura decatromicini]TYK51312.1 LLM class flavin-dependent oxidoreductase [Actinomadura decatromicini]